MIDLLSYFFRDFALIRKSEFDLHEQYPTQVERYMLLWLVLKGRNTLFGKEHNFDKINSVKKFQENVSVSHYSDLKPYIQRMMQGEENILWPSRVHFFTKSSATTGESKYIPVSKTALYKCHYKGGKDMITLYVLNNPQTKLFSGKVLSLCGTLESYPENTNIEVGDISAIMTKNLPLYAQLFRFPEPELSLKNGWENKIEEISTLSLKENITGIIGVPMWTAAFIKKVLEKSGKNSIYEVWPNLEVFMHGGISFKPYESTFDELFKNAPEGRNMKYIESYNASEGYFAIQDDLSKKGEMRLMLDYGVFYEFIPLDKYIDGVYEAITLDEVVIGINYVLLITTNGGLWRYVIGDTVMFTNLSPHRIKITGRTKQYLNTYDEEITMENVEEAISFASKETDCIIENFTMCPTIPDKDGKGAHEWIVEFNKEPKDINIFTLALDEFLKKENGDYRERRINNIVLNKPILHMVPKNTFYNWMKSKNRLGGQYKVPRVTNHRDYVEELLKLK